MLLALVLPGTALAAALIFSDSVSCVDAEHSYRMEQRALAALTQGYLSCVAQDFARDDCSGKFSALAGEQWKFATAVANVRSVCGQ
jgi:predicted nucleic acid binding AN1-type Zn finger protein